MGKKRRQGAPGGSRGAPTHRKSDPGPTFSTGDRSVLRGTPRAGRVTPDPRVHRGCTWSLAIAAAAVLVYLNAFGHEFVLDDTRIIRDNLRIRSLANIPGAVSIVVLGHCRGAVSLPPAGPRDLRLQLRGAWPLDTGFTAVNVALHAAVSVLLFALVRTPGSNHGRSPAWRGSRLPSIPCTRRP